MHIEQPKVKVLHSALFVSWNMSIDYENTDKGCVQNVVVKWISVPSGYELYIKNRFDTG